ncbi:MAG TPA: glycosyltransferase family 39 protein [Bryobacteraceae bacterium]
MSRRAQVLIIVAAVLLMRLPFIDQAVAGDDVTFLYGAEHALIEPLHPLNAKFAFNGEIVDMRGHTHGPVDPWILAFLLTIFGSVKEVPFHLFYILFSLIAALAAWSIASRFTDHALEAVLLFLVVPPFVVSGNSFEADLPFLAFWLLAVALYLSDHPIGSAAAAVLATLTAYQAVLLTPILFFAPGVRRRWLPLLAPPAAFVIFQVFERTTGGDLPAAVLANYMSTHGWQSLHIKLLNAIALCGHLIVNIVSPIAWIGFKRSDRDRFPLVWIGIFFAGALAIFFAGAARYLLPMALPVCILASRSRFVWPAIAIEAALSFSLATVNFQHWNGYREIAREVPKARRVFVNGEWGIRHYVEEAGGTALLNGQRFRPGDIVVSTAYAPKIDAPSARLFEREITSPIPLRMMDLAGGSAFSAVGGKLWPFAISTAPMDRVTVESIIDVQPTLSYVKIQTPEGAAQIISGVSKSDGWTAQPGLIALVRPAGSVKLRAIFYVPPNGVGREVRLAVDGVQVAAKRYDEAGLFTLDSEPLPNAAASRAVVAITTDKPLRVLSDNRALGVVLSEVGFVQQP